MGVGIVNGQKVMSDDARSDDASKIALQSNLLGSTTVTYYVVEELITYNNMFCKTG